MTVPELFHHEDRFVGALGVRRGAGGALQLSTQGLDFPSRGACPALRDDGLCDIHDDRKPAMCITVPLDPRVADPRQHLVLIDRARGAAYIGADCIVPGTREGMAVLVDGGAVVAPPAREQLARHRRALGDEDRQWADAVAAMVGGQAPAPHGPAGGVLTLPLVPVLAVLASRSDRCRERCLHYARRQISLLEQRIADALARRDPRDRAVTQEFRHYASAYERFGRALGTQPSATAADASRTEAYLGLTAAFG